uniref:Uncharacterized protein n=1 Tax=Peronospora matthiolae TaxID=2874970 RepID=A0AAV1TZV6_9STRA
MPVKAKTPTHSSQTAQCCAKAVHELDKLLGGDNKVAVAEATTNTGGVDSEPIVSLAATEMALARVQVDEAQRKVVMLSTKAAEKQRIADSKKQFATLRLMLMRRKC